MEKLSHTQMMAEVLDIVSHANFGVLASIDDEGRPQIRWMGGAILHEGIRRIYCLTGRHTRKISQLRNRPQVTWMFHDHDFGRVATLHGHAAITDSVLATQNVWDRLLRTGRPYLVSVLGEESSPEMSVIETQIHLVELLAPKHHLFQPVAIELPKVTL